MNIREGVLLAQAGDERGFGYLYENTYKSKYYLALRYMKNEEEAKDVLQEAYIRAFQHLDQLQNPETFVGWLGTIVANTAKNALMKKNPMLFSDVSVDAEDESFEFQIEDDNVDNQPEIAYTRKETQELVHELMDTLSPEQRICLLMFHIEGASISEIAQTLNCSENTVKSRLNYGRKNLKIKAEDLQKKGYKLYSLAPLPLLLLLLREDRSGMIADGTMTQVGSEIAAEVFQYIPTAPVIRPDNFHQNIASGGTTGLGKSGLLHAFPIKYMAILGGVITMCGATIFGVSRYTAHKEENRAVREAAQPETTPTEEEHTASDTEQQTTETPVVTEAIPDEKEAADTANPTSTISANDTNPETQTENTTSIREIYTGVLQSVQAQEDGYTFTNPGVVSGSWYYDLRDMDGDGIQDLVVAATSQEDVFELIGDFRVFSVESGTSGYQLKTISGEIATMGIYVPADGAGLYAASFSRGTGVNDMYRVTVQGGSLVTAASAEYHFIMGDSEEQTFRANNPVPSWKDISDLSGLDGLNPYGM